MPRKIIRISFQNGKNPDLQKAAKIQQFQVPFECPIMQTPLASKAYGMISY